MKVVYEADLSPWQFVGSRDVRMETRHLKASIQKFRHPITGAEYEYSQYDRSNYVTVFPVTGAGSVIMTEQWKQGVHTARLQVPGGRLVEGKDPLATAAENLLADTGYLAGGFFDTGTWWDFFDSQTSSGYMIVIAHGCTFQGRTETPDAKITRVIELAPDEFWNFIRLGKVHDPGISTAANLARLHGYLQ